MTYPTRVQWQMIFSISRRIFQASGGSPLMNLGIKARIRVSRELARVFSQAGGELELLYQTHSYPPMNGRAFSYPPEVLRLFVFWYDMGNKALSSIKRRLRVISKQVTRF